MKTLIVFSGKDKSSINASRAKSQLLNFLKERNHSKSLVTDKYSFEFINIDKRNIDKFMDKYKADIIYFCSGEIVEPLYIEYKNKYEEMGIKIKDDINENLTDELIIILKKSFGKPKKVYMIDMYSKIYETKEYPYDLNNQIHYKTKEEANNACIPLVENQIENIKKIIKHNENKLKEYEKYLKEIKGEQ